MGTAFRDDEEEAAPEVARECACDVGRNTDGNCLSLFIRFDEDNDEKVDTLTKFRVV